jgi:hypothetical protein
LDASIEILIERRHKNLRTAKKEREERLKAAKEAARDARLESLRLDIEFTQTRGNVNAEIRARQALIRRLTKLKASVERGTNAWKEYRNAIAAEKEAIKKLREEQKGKRDAARELFFEFLQAQQSFVSTLLSNVLPAGVLGLALGGGIVPPTPPSSSVAAAAQTSANAQRGATQGQTASMIEILRQILIVLKGQSSTHPEAQRQRRTGSAVMDVM